MPISNPSASNPSAATGSQPLLPDMQQLVGLLGNLMPLLLHFQSQVLESSFQAGLGNVAVPNPANERQEAVNLIGDMNAETLRNLSTYLEANAGQYASLDRCAPIVTQATQRFAARDYAQAFNLIWSAYLAIETIRAADPEIPPLRAGGQAPSDQTSSFH